MWREIVEVVQEEGMEQLIEFPTHIKSYILYLVLTTCPEKLLTFWRWEDWEKATTHQS